MMSQYLVFLVSAEIALIWKKATANWLRKRDQLLAYPN